MPKTIELPPSPEPDLAAQIRSAIYGACTYGLPTFIKYSHQECVIISKREYEDLLRAKNDKLI